MGIDRIIILDDGLTLVCKGPSSNLVGVRRTVPAGSYRVRLVLKAGAGINDNEICFSCDGIRDDGTCPLGGRCRGLAISK